MSVQPMPRRSMVYEVVFFVALLATALAMGAALAHLLELPNKIGLSGDDYFVVQGIYRGWDRLAFLLLIQLVAMVSLAVMSRDEPRVLWPVAVAILCLVAAQALFWMFTFPANTVTSNWSVRPENWEAVRARWEYSHAGGAVFQILAMSALVVAALARARA